MSYNLKFPNQVSLKEIEPMVNDERTADYYHTRGYGHRKRGEFNAAIRDYTVALKKDPSHFKESTPKLSKCRPCFQALKPECLCRLSSTAASHSTS